MDDLFFAYAAVAVQQFAHAVFFLFLTSLLCLRRGSLEVVEGGDWVQTKVSMKYRVRYIH